MKKCEWHRQGICFAKKCSKNDCDLYKVPFESKKIKQRMKEEAKYIKEHRTDKSKKDIIHDKIMGIKALLRGYTIAKRLRK